ncbi:MAG: hypothetical protein WCK65_13430 [Rhodospirillaceae bacterium]
MLALFALAVLVGIFFFHGRYANSNVSGGPDGLCNSAKLETLAGFPPTPSQASNSIIGSRGRFSFGKPYSIIGASLDQFSPVADDKDYFKYLTAIYSGFCHLDVGDYFCLVTIGRNGAQRVDIKERLVR